MFFYKGNNTLTSLTEIDQGFFIDQGWSHSENIWYKGYSTDCVLADNVKEIVQQGYRPRGKWCVLHNNEIFHPDLRGFPVYSIGDDLTNIPFKNAVFMPQSYDYTIDSKIISLDDAAEQIGNILEENIVNFYKYNSVDRMNVLFTMGIDSMTVWAILDKLTKDYNLHIHLPEARTDFKGNFGVFRDYDSDLLTALDNHWAYKMTRIYSNKNYFLTGFYSERFQLREITTGQLIAKFLNTHLTRMVKPKDYLYHFVHRKDNLMNTMPRCTTEAALKQQCFETILGDYQMWHVDNNFHFSPFYDIRIAQICQQMSLDDICKNAANALIQRKIIERYNPEFLSLLADYKNCLDTRVNFKKNWHKIKLDRNVNINITA